MQPGGILRVRFPFSAAYQEADRRVRVGDLVTTQETTPKTAATTQETVQNSTRRRILSLLSDEPRITQVAIAERLGITRDGVSYHFRKLRADGIIRRVGSSKSGRWEVVRP